MSEGWSSRLSEGLLARSLRFRADVQSPRSSVNDRFNSMNGGFTNGDYDGRYCRMKTNPQCALIGCSGTAVDKHHIGGASSPMIWVCKECHGRIHGLQWNSEHSALTRAGLAKARAQGRRGGNPKLLDGDPDFIDAMNAARKERHRQQILAGMNEWLPLVQELRPLSNWKDVARYVTQRTGVDWSEERLRRTVTFSFPEATRGQHGAGVHACPCRTASQTI